MRRVACFVIYVIFDDFWRIQLFNYINIKIFTLNVNQSTLPHAFTINSYPQSH